MRLTLRRGPKYSRRRAGLSALLVIALAATVGLTRTGHAAHTPPAPVPVPPSSTRAINPIMEENLKRGTTAWQIRRFARSSLEGFASSTSVMPGGRVVLYVSSRFPMFSVDVYRMGWYDGAGARLIWTGRNVTGHEQHAPTVDPRTRMVEADWSPTLTIPVDSRWATGVYLTRLTAPDGRASFVPFTVREGAHRAPIVFESSVATWQAYNDWGGHSLYTGLLNGRRSTKLRSTVVSFDRPYATGVGAGDFFSMEFPLLSWFERQGYDVGYATNIDAHEDPTLLSQRRAFLSAGHDEYWSTAMRDHVEKAIASGVNAGFLGANAMFRHVRFENSRLGADRREINYRSASADPVTRSNPAESTVQWRDRPVNRAEDGVLGAMYECNPVHADAVVYDPLPWLFRGTGLRVGDRVKGLIGREYDRVFRDASHPHRLWVLFRSPLHCAGLPSVADTTFARFPSGAGVFDAATQGFVCAFSGCPGTPPDVRVQRLLHNLIDAFLGRNTSGSEPSPRPFSTGPTRIRLPHSATQRPEQTGTADQSATVSRGPRRP